MDDLEENFDFEDGESANIRLLQFSKDVTFLKLNKIHILKSFKILNIVFEIEKTFLLTTELDLSNFCIILWKQLLEIRNDLKKEMLHSYELNFALDDLLHLTEFFVKGGDSRGFIQ